MFRIRLLLALLISLWAFPLWAQQRSPAASPQVKSYTLSPDKYDKAVAFSRWRYTLHFLGVLWTAGTLLVMLHYRVTPRLRNWAEGATHRRFLQAALFVPAFILAVDLVRAPLDLFEHWLNLHYEQSVQGWVSWLWDWTKGELLGFAIGIVL